MYKVKLRWETPVSGKILTNIWNLLQGWSATNDCVIEGKVETYSMGMDFRIIVKRRLGAPKDKLPWG